MDILYIVGNGTSNCDNFELKCSLRSIDYFGKNVGRVFVAGYCPEWLSDEAIKVPFEQPYQHTTNVIEKANNILATILYAVDNTDIDDEFLVSMDDHFYVRPVDFGNYPYHVKAYGKYNEFPVKGNNIYADFLAKTRRFCKKHNITYKYFCPHRNMHCSREIINETREILNEVLSKKIACESLAFMLNWKNSKYGVEIVPIRDIKISSAQDWYLTDPIGTEIFSTADFGIESELYLLMCGRYPDKSKYEK